MQIKAVNLEKNTKHTNIFLQNSLHSTAKTKWRWSIYGDFSSVHPLNYSTRALILSLCYCFPNMVCSVVLKFPRTKVTNHKQKFLRKSFADWLLFSTARKFKLCVASFGDHSFLSLFVHCISLHFISFAVVSRISVVHHAWCRQSYREKRQHWQAL